MRLIFRHLGLCKVPFSSAQAAQGFFFSLFFLSSQNFHLSCSSFSTSFSKAVHQTCYSSAPLPKSQKPKSCDHCLCRFLQSQVILCSFVLLNLRLSFLNPRYLTAILLQGHSLISSSPSPPKSRKYHWFRGL